MGGSMLIFVVIGAIMSAATAEPEQDPLLASGSSFFPQEYLEPTHRTFSSSTKPRVSRSPSGSSTFKFPDSGPERAASLPAPAPSPVSEPRIKQVQAEQRLPKQFFQIQDVISAESSGGGPLDDIDSDEKQAIDIILAATKTGRKFDIGEGTNEIKKITSDPKIKEQVAAGNDAEARNYIRRKLCLLGLMPCARRRRRPARGNDRIAVSKYGDYGFDPAPYSYGTGYDGGGGGGLSVKDVALVQPVALKPVGAPIQAIPLEPFGNGLSHSPLPLHDEPHEHYPPPTYAGKQYGYGHGPEPDPEYVVSSGGPSYDSGPPGPVYAPPNTVTTYTSGPIPIPGPPIYESGPIYDSSPIYAPPPTESKAVYSSKPGSIPLSAGATGGNIVEHVHHHIHHTPSVGDRPSPANYGVIGGLGSVSAGNGLYGGSSGLNGLDEYGAAQRPSISLATPSGATVRPAFGTPFNSVNYNQQLDNCVCVRINQCTSYDIVPGGTSGRETIQGTGTPNSGLVGYNIDPRSKVPSAASAPVPASTIDSNYNYTMTGTQQVKVITPVNAGSKSIHFDEMRGESQKHEVYAVPAKEDVDVDTEKTTTTASTESGTTTEGSRSTTTAKSRRKRQTYAVINNTNKNNGVSQPRLFGRLLGFEPTFGVSFGLPGGYPQPYGGYPLNPVGTGTVVNPYYDGIPIGPVSVNPLVSLQVGKDKDKTKIIKPLVNLHVTPNHWLLAGVKNYFHKKFKGGWYPPYAHGHGYPPPYPVPVYPQQHFYPQQLPGAYQQYLHHHQHNHYHKPAVGVGGLGWSSAGIGSGAGAYASAYTGGYSSPIKFADGGGGDAGLDSLYGGYGTGYGDFRTMGIGNTAGVQQQVQAQAQAQTQAQKTGSTFALKTMDSQSQNQQLQQPNLNNQYTYAADPASILSSLNLESGGIRTNEDEQSLDAIDNSIRQLQAQIAQEEALNAGAGEASSGGYEGAAAAANANSYFSSIFNTSPGANANANRGRTYFPSDDSGRSQASIANANPSQSQVQHEAKTVLPIYGHGPTDNIQTRLPVHATSQDATTASTNKFNFPNEGRASASAASGSGTSFNSASSQSSSHGQGRRVTFPEQGSGGRTKRQAQVDARVLVSSNRYKSERQLNLGTCPAGYVCCRNPQKVPPPTTVQSQYRPQQSSLFTPQTTFNTNTNSRPTTIISNAYPSSPPIISQPQSPFVTSSNYLGSNQVQPQPQQRPQTQFITSTNYNNLNNGGNDAFSQGYGVCGKRNARGITGRVTNPNQAFAEGDTDYGEYPWQVAILKKDGYDNVYVCGGSVIDSRHVLTAAHCIKGLNPADLRVRLGEWDVNHETEFYPHIEKDVAGFAIHPDFYAGNLFNDIAIIRLEGLIDFRQSPHISPVCIPPYNYEFAGRRCFVTGWGKDAFGEIGKYQNILKEVELPVLSHFDCEQKLKRTRLGPDFVLHSGFVCAGGEEGKDACKGDGGGPLVCDVQGTWQLAGIVSWGVGCGQYNVPGVYVKVSQYNDWIKKTISG